VVFQGNIGTSPTVSRSLTAQGTIVGTMQYMSPEQLEGKEADARSDIFSFGAMLYEMATGKKAFEAKSQASLIAAILKDQPRPMRELQPMTPLLLDRIVKTCLAKDPDERPQSAHDLKLELEWIRESSGISDVASLGVEKSSARRAWLPWVIAAALMVGTAVWEMVRPAAAPANPLEKAHFTRLTDFESVEAAISPDGRFLAFVSDHDGPFDVWLTQVGTGRLINLT
jgi:serine/threonine protein kinase